jgi:formate C-acetyltransferase
MDSLSIMDLLGVVRAQALAEKPVLASQPPALREAQLFRIGLERLPLGLRANSSLAGDLGWDFLSPEQREAYLADRRRLAAATPPPPANSAAETAAGQLWDTFHCSGNYTLAHTCADYQRVVEKGLDDVLAEITARRQTAATDGEQAQLEAMQLAVSSLGVFAGRFAVLAAQQAEPAADADAKAALARTAAACAQVPMRPARSFHEALQAIWLVHLSIGISERDTASLSLGRIDQFLLPFYHRDRACGVPVVDLKHSLRDFFLKLNGFGDAACTVNLGGLDAQDHELFNELSALIVETATELALPAPILAARLHDRFPDDAFAALLNRRLVAIGQPTFYGERPCREAMIRRGVPAAEAPGFALNSCMGLVMPGREISDMWGAVINLPLPLELALNGGQPLRQPLPIPLTTPPAVAEFATFDALFGKFREYVEELVGFCVARNQRAAERVAATAPNPFLSAITGGCIRRATDRAGGGADYHCVIVEGFGWANVADALVAIDRLVFREARYALTDLVRAAATDYAGPGDAAVLQAVRACPKYGNGDPEADAMAQRLSAAFAGIVTRHDHGRVHYLPSYHTLNAHVEAGRKTAATLDGRHAGEPLGKQLGPVPGRNQAGLTGLLLSASAIDQRAFSGGQALDLTLDLAQLADPAWREKFKALLLTYFQRGGLQIQVNGLAAEQLRAAIAAPAAHRDLIVRIAGYSDRFTNLGRPIQDDMVRRAEHGL